MAGDPSDGAGAGRVGFAEDATPAAKNLGSGAVGPDLSTLAIHDNLRRPGKTTKFLAWLSATLGLLVLLSGAALYLLQNRKPLVSVALAKAGDTSSAETVLNASGYVTPRRRATIAAKITGRVSAMYAEEGMRVAEGQVLAELDESDARVRLDSAKADRDASVAAIEDLQVRLGNAQRELARARALQESGIRTVEALDQAQTTADSLAAQLELAKTQVKAAEARIVVAQQDVDNATIRAPFAGMVVSKDAQVGEMVSPVSAGGGYTRTGIATVVDMKSLEIEVDVNESYIARVEPGQPVSAMLDAYPDWRIPAHVRTVIPTADRQKATVKVRISFDKLDPRILPDMGVKVAFLRSGDLAKRAIARAVVPEDAVQRKSGRAFVWLVKDGRVEQRAVEVAEARGGEIPVLAGVNAGDALVVKGQAALRDGEAVRTGP